MAHVAGYIHFVLKDEALQRDYPLMALSIDYEGEPSNFQKLVYSCLKKILPDCTILMEHHQNQFAYLGSPVDIAIQNKANGEVIGFVEVEGHSNHYEQSGEFNRATAWKQDLLQGFAKKENLAFGIVGNSSPTTPLTEDQILAQLDTFLNDVKLRSQVKSKQSLEDDFYSIPSQPPVEQIAQPELKQTTTQPETEEHQETKPAVTEPLQEKQPASSKSAKKRRRQRLSEQSALTQGLTDIKPKPSGIKDKEAAAKTEINLARNKKIGVYAMGAVFLAGAVAYGVYQSVNPDNQPS